MKIFFKFRLKKKVIQRVGLYNANEDSDYNVDTEMAKRKLMDKCMAINDRSNKLPLLEEFDDITTTVSDSLGLGLKRVHDISPTRLNRR